MPKVFISYSYDNDDHIKWVNNLATHLRANGVDVIFDQFETKLGSDLALFMEQGLSISNRVICICSEIYNQKANAGMSGTGYEKRIICGDLIKDSSTTWVIPLIRNNSTNNKLPTFLHALKYIDFEDDCKYEEMYYDLLRDIYDQRNLPPLGNNPFVHNQDILGKISEMNEIVSALYCTNNHAGKESFNYLRNGKKFVIGNDLFKFDTQWSDADGNSIYAYRDNVKAIACASGNMSIKNFDITRYDFSSRAIQVFIGENVIWINEYGKILITKIENLEYKSNHEHMLTILYKILEI
ncbi:MAG: toll/interleukin-1 receptor domain-containing protein [Treponema sp.]|nr:toll/interleukin-1 receptor domain-containing protein [Treponema sp.]